MIQKSHAFFLWSGGVSFVVGMACLLAYCTAHASSDVTLVRTGIINSSFVTCYQASRPCPDGRKCYWRTNQGGSKSRFFAQS